VAVDTGGGLFIADQSNHAVRLVEQGSPVSAVVFWPAVIIVGVLAAAFSGWYRWSGRESRIVDRVVIE